MDDLDYKEFHFDLRGQDVQWAAALMLRSALEICKEHNIQTDLTTKEESDLIAAIEHHKACIDAWYIAKYGCLPKYCG